MIILGSPHLMLSNIRGNDRFSLCCLIDLLDHIRTGQYIMIVIQRIFFLQIQYMRFPLRMRLLGKLLVYFCQNILQITDKRSIRSDIFIDFSRININMYDFCICREGLRISDHAVGKAGTERYQKITLGNTEIGCLCTVHTDHACVHIIIAVKCALAHQRITYRAIQLLSKISDLLAGS